MANDSISSRERWAGLACGVAILAWSAAVTMFVCQIFFWLLGAAIPHPSVLGVIRVVSHWFDLTAAWAENPRAGFSAYNVLKHMYVASSCLVTAAISSVSAVMLIKASDRCEADQDAARVRKLLEMREEDELLRQIN